MTYLEQYLRKRIIGKWYTFKETPDNVKISGVIDAIKNSLLYPDYIIEVRDHWDMFRIMPNKPKKRIGTQKEMDKAIIQGHQVVIFHDRQRIDIKNCIPVSLKTVKSILAECKQKYSVKNNYSVSIN